MRLSIVISTLALTSSVLALPTFSLGSPFGLVRKDDNAAIPAKREPLLGDTINSLLATLSPTLTNTIGTVINLDAAITRILNGAESDVNGTLDTVKTQLQTTINKVKAVVTDIGVPGTLDTVSAELTKTITNVQGLIADVNALAGTADVPATVNDVQRLSTELLTILTGVLASVQKA